MQFMTDKEYKNWVTQIQNQARDIAECRKTVNELKEMLNKINIDLIDIDRKTQNVQKGSFEKEYGEKVIELEIKMSKLWDLLTEKTPKNKDKLNKAGSRVAQIWNH